MRLIKLILSGYKRFGLSNIQKLTYTPESIEQVILGSNGSGKSSLLSEILNLVPDGKDFTKGGFKEYHLEHNGNMFVLTSTYNVRAGTHHFSMNGVELNDGNTQATQKELVTKYIGLTQDIIDLMTGKIRLSKMSPNVRREWMMRISGTDFTYALNLHEFFRTKTRSLQGTIETLLEFTHRMATEIETLEADYKTQDAEIQQLQQMVDEITKILIGQGNGGGHVEIFNKMSRTYQIIKDRSNSILAESIIKSPGHGGRTIEKLESTLDVLRLNMAQINGECNEHEKALEGIRSLIQHVGREALDDPSMLENQIKTIKEEIERYRAEGADYECHGESPERLLAVAESIQEGLSELCARIPSNSGNTYTRGTHQERVERHKRIGQAILENSNIISKMEAQLEHAEHTPDTNCPKCSFTFKPGWDPRLIEQTKEQLASRRNAVESMRSELAELDIHIGDFSEYSNKLSELARIRESSKSLRTFWDEVSTEQLVKNYPSRIPVKLNRDIMTLTNLVKVHRLTGELKELESRLELVKNSGDPKYLLGRADHLEAQLFEKSNRVREMTGEVGTLSEEIYHLEKMDKMVDEMQQALDQFQELEKRLEVALQEDCLKQLKERCVTRLGILHQQTHRYRDLLVRYESNRDQIKETEARHGSYKVITEALSPTKGIVAETVKGFIGHFVDMLNGHVGMVWNYDMQVGAVLEDAAALNCKFPICINGEDGADDVSDGSTGQVSMIDFAFKLVVCELLGMTDYPLLADEFGKDFDDEHRERLVTYIKSLVEQNRFSQLFMVSHYSSVYSAFNNAEFVVLDDRNITRPSVCNEHLEIE